MSSGVGQGNGRGKFREGQFGPNEREEICFARASVWSLLREIGTRGILFERLLRPIMKMAKVWF